ncbi:MAG: DUF2254 domain-containing protein [Acidimicrobiales bacterium]|nr:DUF2254 domain-containing protein [Acidimicrobiales bacterium]
MARQPGSLPFGRWLPEWRRESLRTNLWLLPTLLTVAVVLLFVATYEIDQAVHRGDLSLPSWMDQGSADAGRQVLSAIAAGVITVAGVVFSVTIVVLTLASQQFGPRMLRNLIRDVGTQVSLGAYVATFVYTVLALGSISSAGPRPFVPHLSISVCLLLLLVDIVVLIYFIHHIAVTIQLPQVMAGISKDLHKAIDLHFPEPSPATGSEGAVLGSEDVIRSMPDDGVVVVARRSGYLQFIDRDRLVAMAARHDCVVQLLYRPGHFVTTGLPMARIWPPTAAPSAAASLERLHVSGSQRTLAQDPVFAVDQLVEIAIRALSPAVNDTFTAITCIDWLSDGLCVITRRDFPEPVYRDRSGAVRVVEPKASYARIVNRAHDKIRQAGRGMPAVLIRQIDGLGKVMVTARTRTQVRVLLRQADMIWRAGMSDIAEPEDRRDLQRRYDDLTERFGLPESDLTD